MESLFTWDTYFEIGIDKVDRQHKSLIDNLNKGIQKCLSDTRLQPEEVHNLKGFLTDSIITHFQTEEELMGDYNIDSRYVAMHHAAHTKFIEEFVRQVENEQKLTDPGFLNNTMEYMISWMANHILNVDKSLGRQIAGIKLGLSPEIAYFNELQNTEPSTAPLLKALQTLFYIVAEKNKQLEQTNKELENRVRLRTAELENANKKLKLISLKDDLTKLHNRRYAITCIKQLLAEWHQNGIVFSLMFIDVDHFKSVNDIFGHECGDKILCGLSNFMLTNLRQTDIVCRFGGDEFLVICPNSTVDSTLKTGKRLIEQSRKLQKDFKDISFSIGVTEVQQETNTISDILNRADTAMYLVKKNGGNGITKI